MKLVGSFKKQAEQAASKTEANDAILSAGMELSDDELTAVTGGVNLGDQHQSYNIIGGKSPLSGSQKDNMWSVELDFFQNLEHRSPITV
ncbi:MAG: hypothetical protein K6G03_07630 [Lachnospiraceae bacterium]|nr:hypothetical protein [Lachnospiraceae bacterium]